LGKICFLLVLIPSKPLALFGGILPEKLSNGAAGIIAARGDNSLEQADGSHVGSAKRWGFNRSYEGLVGEARDGRN
jgi:hypothetical protein